MITNETKFLSEGGWESRDSCERLLYKYTHCGAWIEFRRDAIVVGSIVEGADFGTASYILRYNPGFSIEDFYARVSAIEEEAKDIWEWANLGPSQEQCEEMGIDYQDGICWADCGIDCPDTSREYGMYEQGERSA